MNLSPEELGARLKVEGQAVLAFFQALNTGQWNQDVYSEDDVWRVRDLLAHFIAAEQGFQALIQNVAAGGAGLPADFNINDYNRVSVSKLREMDETVLLGQFAMVRERTTALVYGLHPEQLQQKGSHPFLGVVTLDEMIRAIYHHNSLHLRDVKKALRGLEAGRLTGSGVRG